MNCLYLLISFVLMFQIHFFLFSFKCQLFILNLFYFLILLQLSELFNQIPNLSLKYNQMVNHIQQIYQIMITSLRQVFIFIVVVHLFIVLCYLQLIHVVLNQLSNHQIILQFHFTMLT